MQGYILKLKVINAQIRNIFRDEKDNKERNL